MRRKVLGIMLFFGLLPMLFACQQQTTTTTVAQLEAGQIAFELYDVENVMVNRTVVEHEQGDTLFGLLRETYTVYCQGSDGSPDSSCSFEGQYGYYIMGIDTITAFEGNVYIAFYINGEYALTGIDSTPITDQYVYQFKLETF